MINIYIIFLEIFRQKIENILFVYIMGNTNFEHKRILFKNFKDKSDTIDCIYFLYKGVEELRNPYILPNQLLYKGIL